MRLFSGFRTWGCEPTLAGSSPFPSFPSLLSWGCDPKTGEVLRGVEGCITGRNRLLFSVSTSPRAGVQSIAIGVSVCLFVRLSVCLYVYPLACLNHHTVVWLSLPGGSTGRRSLPHPKGKERKSIYIALFIYYVYLKALRHGSHSFTCKYTMPDCLPLLRKRSPDSATSN